MSGNQKTIQPLSAILEGVPDSEYIQSELYLTESVQMFLRAGYVNDYGENAGVCRNLEDYFTVGNRGGVKAGDLYSKGNGTDF